MILQNPRPTTEEILRCYPDEYDAFNKGNPSLRTFLEYHYQQKPLLKYLLKDTKADSDFLEIGCGTGETLKHLKQFTSGKLVGVEPSDYAARVGRENNIDVLHGTLDSINFDVEAKFDVIFLIHVLEHFDDPARAVEIIKSLLKPNGKLVGEVPCIDCLEYKIFKKYWIFLHLPRHLTFFSRTHLVRFLKKHGFEDIELVPVDSPSNWVGSVSNWMNAKGTFGVLRATWSMLRIPLSIASVPVSKLMLWFNSAPSIRFECRFREST